MNPRAAYLLAALSALLLVLPLVADSYLISLATLILYLAYTGQAWNLMMGFAGQLSLGHALYLGVGAYGAAALYHHFGIAPWAGMWLAIGLCVSLAASLGFLAFRYGISGVYFTLLTIAFAEFARALATRPKLLLLDEVMAGLRPTECDEMVALFREINRREGLSILLVEHVVRAIMALAHNVLVLHHGEVIAQDAPAQVVRNPAVLDCYLGEDTEL